MPTSINTRQRAAGVAVFLCACLVARTTGATPVLSLAPSAGIVQPGDDFRVDVNITGVEDLISFEIELVVAGPSTVQSDAEGSFLNGGDPTASFYFVDAPLRAFDTALPCTPPSGPTDLTCGADHGGTLFSVFLKAGAATSTMTFGDVFLFNSLFDPQFDKTTNPGLIDVGFDARTVTVAVTPSETVVPEPATLGLVTIGIGALARRKRRRG